MSDDYRFKNAEKTGKAIYAEVQLRHNALLDLGTSIISAAQRESNKREKEQNPPRSH